MTTLPLPPPKLQVTLQDAPVDVELAQYKRMFQAACVALGEINEALGLDPNDGGAEPILDAISEMKVCRADLEKLIKATHSAKGRHHSQLAMCDLYDAVGLPNTRPEKKR